METVRPPAAFVEPGRLGRLQQAVGADHVGGDECIRPGDRAVDVALRGEVDDRVDPPALDQLGDEIGMADVALDQLDPVEPVEVRAVPRIGEQVEDDDAVVGRDRAPVVDEVGADEAGPAGDDQVSHRS